MQLMNFLRKNPDCTMKTLAQGMDKSPGWASMTMKTLHDVKMVVRDGEGTAKKPYIYNLTKTTFRVGRATVTIAIDA